jgi:hypothetical protein
VALGALTKEAPPLGGGFFSLSLLDENLMRLFLPQRRETYLSYSFLMFFFQFDSTGPRPKNAHLHAALLLRGKVHQDLRS